LPSARLMATGGIRGKMALSFKPFPVKTKAVADPFGRRANPSL